MAFLQNIELQGFFIGTYIKVTPLHRDDGVDRANAQVLALVETFANQEHRTSGVSPIKVETVDARIPVATAPDQVHTQVYMYLKTLPGFANSLDV